MLNKRIVNYIMWSAVFVTILLIKSGLSDVQEYCLRSNTEYFEAKCLKNEVVVMSYAIFGRMKIGKCVINEGTFIEILRDNPTFLGCSVDILSFLDKRCSGRNQCELLGGDADLLRLNPCNAALKSYLEASYECVNVVEPDRTCTVSVTSAAQHLMTSHSSTQSCGSRNQPWKLEAPAGQQINVSLLEFGQDTTGVRQPRGFITEEISSKNVSIKSRQGSRLSSIFTSTKNVLKLVLQETEQQREGITPFLIRIEAIGCSNVIPPVDAWLRRDGNTAVVGCYTSRQSWTLRCVDSQWVGVIGNCSLDLQVISKHEVSPVHAPNEHPGSMEVVVIITIVVIGVSICVAIMCTGVVCWKRYVSLYKNYMLHQNYAKAVGTGNGHSIKHQPLPSA